MSNKQPNIKKLKFFENFPEIPDTKQSDLGDENTIKTVDGILEILDGSFIDILESNTLSLKDIKNKKNWFLDLGVDDLDLVQIILDIEKVYNVSILDTAAEEFHKTEPNTVYNSIVSKFRDKKLNDLGL